MGLVGPTRRKNKRGVGGGGGGGTSECWHLEVVHLGEGDDEGELIVLHVELEQRSAPDNLEAGQHNLPHVNM